ncbi:MAG: 2Fe-2S iron-sulfur cluster binding domain-containing protein [Luteitalea sp.]|nr:2Fe-2S iron-sulfur cluster binding domain-containing protein [Luteitalea sp.]
MPRYTLRVNGREHAIEAEPGDSLLSILRDDLELTGSKYGCGEGQCGACTVLVEDEVTRSCVTDAGSVSGKSITTIEGLATDEQLHPVQEAFVEAEALQCGYCTPGMVMAAVGLLRSNPSPSQAEITKSMNNNICRCGTYGRIVRAVELAATRTSSRTSSGSK